MTPLGGALTVAGTEPTTSGPTILQLNDVQVKLASCYVNGSYGDAQISLVNTSGGTLEAFYSSNSAADGYIPAVASTGTVLTMTSTTGHWNLIFRDGAGNETLATVWVNVVASGNGSCRFIASGEQATS